MAINFSGLSSLSSLSSLYGEYASIRSGTYKQLLNAYYSKVDGSKEATMKMFSQNGLLTSSDESDPLTSVKSSATSLTLSAATLTNRGKESVFQKKEVESVDEESGEKSISYEYDKEEISKAVSDFVSSYNAVIDKAADTDSTKVMSTTLNMISNTKAYKSSLEKIGISIGSDNKLTIDEEKFSEANMTSVKSLFNDANSFGQKTMQKATQISSEASREQLLESLYTNTGNYQSYAYSSWLNMYL